jgi:outer membrane receptor protein involved in Fe transport
MISERLFASLAGATFIMAVASPAAAAQARIHYDMPSQELGTALRRLGQISGVEIMFTPADVAGRVAPRLEGDFTLNEALDQILVGAGLTAQISEGTVIIRGRSEAAAPDAAAISDIVVTGTHIRGATTVAPVTILTRSAIKDAGQSDLGQVVRSLPENFGGGQNPTVGSGAGLINTNVNSASNINLFGLGPDATLTLLNGHRLPNDAAFGGVDISAIPVDAIERIEIVTDGASAEYGSDAVAGVANVILRRDFNGVETLARIGAATDSGDVEEQASLVAGTTWDTGGVIATYDYAHNSAIVANQRRYATSLPQGNSLYPAQHRHAVAAAFHQRLSNTIEFKFDGTFSNRQSVTTGGSIAGGALTRYRFAPGVESFSLTPGLDVRLGRGWMAKASLSYGQDNTHYNTLITPPGGSGNRTTGCYCNRALTTELTLDGPVFALPGGEARIAIGGGYRSNGMRYYQFRDSMADGTFDVSRNSHYVFAEAQLPLLGADQNIPLVRSFIVSAAARFEDYPGLARLTTPKFGLIYDPGRDLTIRASWGRSFKAPTLYQQYIGYETYLLPAAAVGAGSSGTILYTSGGNPDLKPERAENWSVGVDLHPHWTPSLNLGVRYFNIRYIDRVTQPVAGSIASAFSDPGYASLIDLDPSEAHLADLIAGSLYGLENYSGGAYVPGEVVALVDNRNRNVATQKIQGINLNLRYSADINATQKLTVTGSATHLQSNQRLTDQLPVTLLAGSVFNPPHWRSRIGATWDAGNVTLSSYVNYIGSVEDSRFIPASTVHSMTTLDLVGRFVVGKNNHGPAAFDITVTLDNIFNAKPDVIRTTGSSDTPYDSTNFSPVGRFIGLTVERKW